VRELANYSYGILVKDNSSERLSVRNEIVITKNTPIPCCCVRTFFVEADQNEFKLTITQGEDKDPRFVTCIAELVLELPSRLSGCHEIQATFSYDSNMRMNCELKDVQSQRISKFGSG